MYKLARVLPRVLARQPNANLLAEHRLRLAFREVLGEAMASACETVELRGTTLAITTANPALAHQLRLDAEDLMRRINEVSRLSRPVRMIRVRVGRGTGGL